MHLLLRKCPGLSTLKIRSGNSKSNPLDYQLLIQPPAAHLTDLPLASSLVTLYEYNVMLSSSLWGRYIKLNQPYTWPVEVFKINILRGAKTYYLHMAEMHCFFTQTTMGSMISITASWWLLPWIINCDKKQALASIQMSVSKALVLGNHNTNLIILLPCLQTKPNIYFPHKRLCFPQCSSKEQESKINFSQIIALHFLSTPPVTKHPLTQILKQRKTNASLHKHKLCLKIYLPAHQ